jgi:hypothetical protein
LEDVLQISVKECRDPVGGAPLLAVTAPVTVTWASGEVLLEEAVAEVVVVRAVEGTISTEYEVEVES